MGIEIALRHPEIWELRCAWLCSLFSPASAFGQQQYSSWQNPPDGYFLPDSYLPWWGMVKHILCATSLLPCMQTALLLVWNINKLNFLQSPHSIPTCHVHAACWNTIPTTIRVKVILGPLSICWPLSICSAQSNSCCVGLPLRWSLTMPGKGQRNWKWSKVELQDDTYFNRVASVFRRVTDFCLLGFHT